MKTQKEIWNEIRITGLRKVMPPGKIAGFYREFPWVGKYFPQSKVVQVYAFTASSAVLSLVPFPGLSDDPETEQILLVDKNGDLVTGETQVSKRKYLFFGPKITKTQEVRGKVNFGETVWSALQRLGKNTERVHAILSYYARTKAVIVHKCRGGRSIMQMLAEETEAERQKFREAIEA